MTRTKRIYNRRLKKTQRDDVSLPVYVNGIRIYRSGFPLTWRSYICMGRCKMCRDYNKEPKLLRKRRKEQFRFDLKNEFKKSKICCDLPINIDYDTTICKICNDC
jgi:hypothetical protein